MIAICMCKISPFTLWQFSTYCQFIKVHLPPPIGFIFQNWACRPCVIIILFVQLLLPKTQVHFLLLEVHVRFLPLGGFPHHLQQTSVGNMCCCLWLFNIQHEKYLPPWLASVPVPMLTQIWVPLLFLLPGMAAPSVRKAHTI